jgi:hypothetical protein
MRSETAAHNAAEKRMTTEKRMDVPTPPEKMPGGVS